MKKLPFVLFVLMAILMTACGSSSESDTPTDLLTAEFTVVANDITYDTNDLEVTAGQPVMITFRNESPLEHDFSIPTIPVDGEVFITETGQDQGDHGHDMEEAAIELDVHVAAPVNGGSNVLQFTPTEPGTYEYYCTVEGHKEAGMVGTLTVQAP